MQPVAAISSPRSNSPGLLQALDELVHPATRITVEKPFPMTFVDKQLGQAVPSPTGSTTSPTTRAGCRSAPRPAPPALPSKLSGAGGTPWAAPRFPKATKLLITADAGGSNGYRLRLWKLEPSKFAKETGLEITVCHYPPGTSKWNRIEHKMFSFISMNWRAATCLLPNHHRAHLGDDRRKRAHHQSRGRSQHLQDRHQDQYAELAAVPLTRHQFPRRLDLHDCVINAR